MDDEMRMDVDENDPLLLKTKKRKSSDDPARLPRKKKKTIHLVADRPSAPAVEYQPRSYQTEVLEKALVQNTIVFLDTGSGKTYIAVMLLNRLAHKLATPHRKRIAVFLAPTVLLVMQQANVILLGTNLKVGVYHGDQTDTWDCQQWSEQCTAQQVLVMTPQIFYNALQLSALSMESIEVIIFDECHHAQKNHPYASIMKTYYHSIPSESKPKIFGMTASLVATKGFTNLKILELESVLDSKIYTVKNRVELEANAPTPNQTTKYYCKPVNSFRELRASLAGLLRKYQEENLCSSCNFKDEKEAKKRISRTLSSLYNGIEICLTELGLWGAAMAVDVYLKDKASVLSKDEAPEIEAAEQQQQEYKTKYLRDVCEALKKFVPAEGSESNITLPDDMKLAADKGFLTPKLEALVVLLTRYRTVDNFRCIVFVERVIVSVVLATLLRRFTCVDFIRTDHMVGVNADAYLNGSHLQSLESFREGTVNVLISTAVAEEGLDVQLCNSVIRFNLCRSVRSLIQSRGRARKEGADYICLLERGNLEEENVLLEMIKAEKAMREEALSRMKNPVKNLVRVADELEVFESSSGLRMSTAGSVSFLFTYCSKLPGDKHYHPRPEFTITRSESVEELYKCSISFPPNAPFHHFEGPERRSKDLAKKVACLEACKKLDTLGYLDSKGTGCLAMEDRMASRDASGSGSTLLKELFPSIKSTTFQGDWLMSQTGASLYLYALKFTPEQDDEQGYMNFVFLINTRLDDDVGNFDLNLYISRTKSVKAKLSFLKQSWLDSTQLSAARVFQEVIINGAFSRLVFREDASDRTIAKCLLTHEPYSRDLWSQMYLLLPMTSGADVDVDWLGVSATVEAAKHFPHQSTVLRRDTPENRSTISLEAGDARVIHTAGGPVDPAAFQDAVVLTVHTGKLFCISEVLYDVNARSLFRESPTSEPCTYESFYIRKHGRLLQYQGQPFLRAKPTHAVHNHLINPNASTRRAAREAPDNLVEIPPELCLVLGLKSTLVRSLYLVPSFMYRFTSLIIASELRARFTKDAPCAHVSKILDALTSTRCSEGFSYETLELFGDSALKYGVSKKLFLVHADKHEGQLSGRRSQAISNAALRKAAVEQNLPAYIRDEPFYATLWLGAGMYRLRKRKCLCRPSNLVLPSSSQPKPTKLHFLIGKTCGEGHRWMCSKTTADVLEALIGAYAIGGGFPGAFEFMKAVKLNVDFESHLIADAQRCSLVPEDAVSQHLEKLSSLENLLSYTFQNKRLLLQAITHATVRETTFCYQRLEFLGDAALDFLVTQHFVQTHPGLTPGLLSDLRAAAVNNDCFARVAVEHGLHSYLRHSSGELQSEISKFVSTMEKKKSSFGFSSLSGPKALADLVESIVGAMLVDMGFDLEKLWTLVKPLLSPLVTPATLVFQPIRECVELCGLQYLDWHWNLSKPGVTLELCVQVGDQLYVESSLKGRKEAKKEAAEKMLLTLKKLGIRHPRWNSESPSESDHRVSSESDQAHRAHFIPSPGSTESERDHVALPDVHRVPSEESVVNESKAALSSEKASQSSDAQTTSPLHDEVARSLSAQSCGASPISCNEAAPDKPPKMILHELCVKMKWTRPQYEEQDAQGSANRRWFSFRISMDVPGIGYLEHVSCLKPNKKRAMDDAAQKLIAQLKTLNILV